MRVCVNVYVHAFVCEKDQESLYLNQTPKHCILTVINE